MEERKSKNFIEQIIESDLESGKHASIHTRFPPEPNGFLHIGHCKAICLNFELAKQYDGVTNLRFDDTNPTTEDTTYVDAIKNDIKWLGYDWEDRLFFASDYFQQLYDMALMLIKKGLAYVDDSTPEEIAAEKGTTTEPGINGKYRDRTIEENLDLFNRMKQGEFPDGSKVLRAKIDMAHPNLLMRDPLMYRIKKEDHHRTGDAWCIYPLYDFTHGQSDAIEGITHSLCSLEFRHHRDLYNWFIENLEIYPSRQIEFSRMNVEYMITSKRKLKRLVEEGLVSGWDDPRMSTISAMRRKGFPAAALRVFCDKVGLTKRENLIEIDLLESCVRDELNKISTRVMVVSDPLLLTITNYPEGQTEMMKGDNNPEDENSGTRDMPFSRKLYIERADFMENAPKKYYRLSEGRNVRLKHAYIVHCEKAIKNEAGEVIEVKCTYYPDSKSGQDNSGVKSKGVLHWVEAENCIPCEIREYGQLFTVPDPTSDDEKDILDYFNKDSLSVNDKAVMEPFLNDVDTETHLQFMRKGYYIKDITSTSEKVIFNNTVALKSSYKPPHRK